MMWVVTLVRSSIRARRGLLALAVCAMAIAVMVPAALPMFADGASARALAARGFRPDDGRPAFAYMFSYSGALHGAVDWPDVSEVDEFLTTGDAQLGLPVRFTASYVSTDSVRLSSVGSAGGVSLTNNGVEFTVHERIEELVEIDGTWPTVAAVGDDQVQVAMSAALAEQVGATVGDEFVVLDDSAALTSAAAQRRIRLVATWRALDPADERWIVDPSQLEDRLIVPKQTLVDVLAAQRSDMIETVRWYSLLDPATLSASRVADLVRAADRTERRAAELLDGVRLDLDPVDELREFKVEADELTRTLQVYTLAPLAALGVFIVFVLGAAAQSRARQIVLLRARGAARWVTLVVVAIEAVVVSGAAVVLGLIGAVPVSRLLGRTSSFLRFDGRPIAARLGPASIARALLVGLVLFVVQLCFVVPTLRQHRRSDSARGDRAPGAPVWQRFGLDVFVMAAGAVAVWVTVWGGRPAVALGGRSVAVVPSLVGVAAGLLAVRMVPRLAERLATVAGFGSGVTALVGLRRLARAPHTTAMPIVLFALSLSSAFFSASLARTLDTVIYDDEYGRVGSDWVVQETDAVVAPLVPGARDDSAPVRRLVPMGHVEAIPGVVAATRVGTYDAELTTSLDIDHAVVFVGVDASSFAASAAFPPPESGEESIPERMRRLAAAPEGVLVPAEFGLSLGDTVTVRLTVDNAPVMYRSVVVGTSGSFPGARPLSGDRSASAPLTIVGNLDFVFQNTGDPANYSIWIRTASPRAVSETTLRDSLRLLSATSPHPVIEQRLAAPVRQGIFALLSVGFVLSLIAATMSLVIGTVFSLRRSMTEFGALQAMGLRSRQVASMIAIELGGVVVAGVGAGLASGWLMSRHLIGRLVHGGASAGRSGLHVTVATDSLAALVVPLVLCVAVAAGAVTLTLRRRRLFELLRLGADQ